MSESMFQDLMNKEVDEIEAPKVVPVGTYEAVIETHEFGESSKKQTPFVQMNLKLLSPEEDVDQDEFEEFGGMEALAGKTVREQFYLTPDALIRLRRFLEVLPIEISGKKLNEAVQEVNGQPVKVYIKHELVQDQNTGEQRAYVRVSDFSAA